MLQGNEAEGADTLFDGKVTKNNRDFQISRKIFQSGLEKFLSCYSSSAPNSLAISSDFLICSIKVWRHIAIISQICKFFLDEFIRLGCNGSTLEKHAVNFLAKTISSPSTKRRHCQIELYS